MTDDFVREVPLLLCLGLLAGAAFSDLVSYTIPNRIVAAILALYPLHALGGVDAFSWATPAAALAVLALGFGLFAWGKFGAGDAKLLAAATLWVGVTDLPGFLTLTALAGGALVLAVAGPHRFVLARAALACGGARLHDGIVARELPYGIAIAAGASALLVPRLLG